MSKDVVSFCPYSGSKFLNEKTTIELLRHSEVMIDKLDIVMGGSGGFRKWLFNPFSGNRRLPQDISADPYGLAIVKETENSEAYNNSLESSVEIPVSLVRPNTSLMRVGAFEIANVYLYSKDTTINEHLKELFSRVKVLEAYDNGDGYTSYKAISKEFNEFNVTSPCTTIPDYKFIITETHQSNFDIGTGSTDKVSSGYKFSYKFEKVSANT